MRSFACVKESSTILTITGSDGTGLSGVQADMKTISALGGYAMSAITCITVQNTLGIQEFYDLPAAVVRSQIEAVVNDIEPQVIKVGLIRSVETLDVIIDAILRYRPRFVVYAPASVSAKGDRLMGEDVLTQIHSSTRSTAHKTPIAVRWRSILAKTSPSRRHRSGPHGLPRE